MTYNERVKELAMKLAGNPVYPKVATADDIEHMNDALLERYKPLAKIAIQFTKEMVISAAFEANGMLSTEEQDDIDQLLTTLGLTE